MSRVNAVLIARNEQRCIERAIRSVIDVVDGVIVLDTGSTDATQRLARAAGAEVVEGRWPGDFSLARNTALALSDAAANLVIDADEWLIEGADWLGSPAARSGERVGIVRVVSTSLADGRPVRSETSSERLLPASVRYRGAVHEQPEHAMGTVRTPLVVAHDGYEPEQMTRKAGRNLTLLQAELQARPGDSYLTYQLGKEWQAGERYAESAEVYAAALAGTGEDVPWRHSLVVRAISVLGKAGRFGEAVRLADAERARWDASPDFHFACGNLFLDIAVADPAGTAELLPIVEASWLRCLEIGERPDLPGAVSGRGGALAAHNLAELYTARGDTSRATRYRRLAQR